MGARNGIFCGHVESDNLGSTGGSGGPERKKSAQAQARVFVAKLRTSLFSGRTHSGSLFLTNFVGLDIFNSPESVPHIHFGSHAEPLQKRFSNVKKSAIL